MKVSEMIKNLQEFMAGHGDIDCYYSEDDEGNGYHEVHDVIIIKDAELKNILISLIDLFGK